MSEFHQQLLKLQHAAVRDLAWCCFSPPLVRAPNTYISSALAQSSINNLILPENTADTWMWLIELDRTPDYLLHHVAQLKSRRLGLYYEALWQFYFSHCPGWELLAYGIQINADGRTQGAFDFLCRYGDRYIHIETAVKFYLRRDDTTLDDCAWHHWLGPHSRDRLDIKLNHMLSHQLQLSQGEAAQGYLQQQFPEAKYWERTLCLQGYLFNTPQSNKPPQHSNPDHAQGTWYRMQDFIQQLKQSDCDAWLVLNRRHWLSPAQQRETSYIIDRQELSALLQQHFLISAQSKFETSKTKEPLLLAALFKFDDVWQETARVFVVPNSWPNHIDSV